MHKSQNRAIKKIKKNLCKIGTKLKSLIQFGKLAKLKKKKETKQNRQIKLEPNEAKTPQQIKNYHSAVLWIAFHFTQNSQTTHSNSHIKNKTKQNKNKPKS